LVFLWFSANCDGSWAVVIGTTRHPDSCTTAELADSAQHSRRLRTFDGDRVASGVGMFPNPLRGRLPMFCPCTAFVAFLVRRAAPVALVLACLWSTGVQSQPPVGTTNDRPVALPQSVEVFGKVVDAETGKPVEAFITQAGHFDPKDPK